VIDINTFIKCLKKNDFNFVTGVPDSLLKNLCFEFENTYKNDHITAANEGAAVGIGIGYHLKTGKIPVIYLQNSGLGNMVNPILSLADPKVFNIPLLIIMGWRGERNKMLIDEPQHMTQGNLTENFLKSMNIRYNIVSKNTDYKAIIKKLTTYSKNNNKISCLLVRKNVF
jgi:phosphonopyruvate decarboxylase